MTDAMRLSDARLPLTALLLWVGGLLVVAPAAPALAQAPPSTSPPPKSDKPPDQPPRPRDTLNDDPELNDESVEDALNDMRKRPAAARPVGPTTRAPAVTVPPSPGQSADPMAGLTGPDSGVPGARRLREGTFLSRREGTMLRIPSGDWVFVPRPTSAGTLDRPMVLMPSQMLQRLEEATALAGARPAAVISGQLFSYRGREYLLPAVPSSASAANAGPQPAESASPNRPPDPGESPGVQDLIRDLESKRSPTRALNPSSATPAQGKKGDPMPTDAAAESTKSTTRASGAPALTEGSLITSRRGRLSRLAGGELAFASDSDADSHADHPLVLLPCQTLSRMEDVTLWRGDSLVLEVSGRILNYQGRNYLLPTMFVVPAPSEVGPLQ